MNEKNLRFLFILFTFFALSATTGCQKTETDPCLGLLSEAPPTKVVVRCVDKQTREPLVIDAADIKITEKQSGNTNTNWGVSNHNAFPIQNGDLVLALFKETPGEYQYHIQVRDLGTLTLSFQIDREETGDACRPYSYPMHDIKIANQPFTVFQHEGKTYPKILVVAL